MTKPSDRKIAANRVNGRKGRGPKDTRSTRFNAVKHGLLAQGETELDSSEGYLELLRDLTKERKPVGVVGIYLVESIAHGIVRSRRVRRLEAEFITEILNPPIHGSGLGVEIAKELSATVVDPVSERLQHLRQDEQVLALAAPSLVEVIPESEPALPEKGEGLTSIVLPAETDTIPSSELDDAQHPAQTISPSEGEVQLD